MRKMRGMRGTNQFKIRSFKIQNLKVRISPSSASLTPSLPPSLTLLAGVIVIYWGISVSIQGV
ncbi:hypothetical protein NIES4073_46370 [Kalymmatonema gypsitolerans NIES-4073]|nr:hypothetical protein NIES4073_46370 [Scytonema sp. NIES-4073]